MFTPESGSIPCEASPDDIRAMVHQLQLELAAKDAVIESQRLQLERTTAAHEEAALVATKLEAAVEHRDAIIAELASSRKLVFEECHKACLNNQTELRQMQDALHKLSRQLHQERREYSARIKDFRRQLKNARLTSSSLSIGRSSSSWDANNSLGGLLSDDSDSSPRSDSTIEENLFGSGGESPSSSPVSKVDDDIDFLTW